LHAAKLFDLGALRSDRLIVALDRFLLRVELLLLRLKRVADESARCCSSDSSNRDTASGVPRLISDDCA
jgi:hypothetical protein